MKNKEKRHVGRPRNEEIKKTKKRKIIKIILLLFIATLIIGSSVYLYINRDFIELASITGNSTTYYKNIHKIQTNNSITSETFNPDTKKKVNGNLYYLQYNHPNGNKIFDYFFKAAGFNQSKYARSNTEVYYNGKLIKNFSYSQKYFFVKSNWAGRTVVLKIYGTSKENRTKTSKYLKLYIPKQLNFSTSKYKGTYYYLINNSKSYYNKIKNNKYYYTSYDGGSNRAWFQNERLANSYASQIKMNIFKEEWSYVGGEKDTLASKAVQYTYGTNIKAEMLKKVYNEISNHNPCILEYRGESKNNTQLVIIGLSVDHDVNNLTLKDFIAIEPYDGSIALLSNRGYSSLYTPTGYTYFIKYYKNK